MDHAGTTLPVIDGATGEVRQARLFVAALGALSLTYAEASWSQNLSDRTFAHCRAFACFGGVPAQGVCDNPKSGVTKACLCEPAVNRTCSDMAEHYGTAVVPAPALEAPALEAPGVSHRGAIGSSPMANAKVEVAVQIAERWIVVSKTRLRHYGHGCAISSSSH